MSIDRDRRAALIALRLSDGGIEKLKWLYRGLELGGAREAKQILAPGYGQVVLLSGAALTGDAFVREIDRLASDEDVDVVDVILVVHGLNGRLQFSTTDVRTAADLAAQLRAAGASPKLRLLYSSACFGATHAQPFLDAGFSTVIGALEKNTTGLSEFRRLLRAWVGGATATAALDAADRPVQRWFWDTTAKLAGRLKHVNSRKQLAGDGELVITTPP
ncbi:MAG: hypothetical protein AB7Q42_16985 [Acidimicrobiia bacterium]